MTTAPAASPAPPAPSVRIAALFAVHFGSAAMMRVCDPMLPALAHEFGVTTGQAAWTVSSYAIAYGLLQFFFGPAGDRWGKRRVIGYAALATLAGNLLALVAPNLGVLVIARTLSGAAAAGIIALVLAWVGDTVEYAQRQAVLAKFLTASLGGMMAGQWVAGVLTEQVGWRAVFGVLVVLFGIGGLRIVMDRSVRSKAHVNATSRGHLRPIAEVVSQPWARAMLVFVALEGAFAFSAIAFLPAYLVSAQGLNLVGAAAIVALYGVGGLGYALTARKLVPRLGEAGLALAGGISLAIAWWTLSLSPPWWSAMPVALLSGFGFYTLHGVMQTHATQMAPQVRGTAVSLFASALFIGISAGVSVAGSVIDRVGYAPVFAFDGLALGVLGMLFAATLWRRQSVSTAGL